jgi:hypothetical protein
MNTLKSNTNENWHFIRNTIFTVLLWTGLWGLISLFIHKYFSNLEEQILVYIIMVIVSFYFLKNENIN